MALEHFSDLVGQASLRYGVPASWINAVIMTESSGDPYAYRAEPQIGDASYGLMQLLLRTARGLGFSGSSDELYDPETNIDLGTRLLADLRSRYGTDFERVYSAYNSGSPTRYLTSTQVAENVRRAVGWLQRFCHRASDSGWWEHVAAIATRNPLVVELPEGIDVRQVLMDQMNKETNDDNDTRDTE